MNRIVLYFVIDMEGGERRVRGERVKEEREG